MAFQTFSTAQMYVVLGFALSIYRSFHVTSFLKDAEIKVLIACSQLSLQR